MTARRWWTWVVFAAFALAAGAPPCAQTARADVVELVGGRVVQGKILPGQTTDEGGLADEVYDTGHRVLLASGQVVEGLALNPDQKEQPLQLKTRTSTQQIDRSQVAR